ncbi:MAG TPA: hypothetical protein DCW68_07260 [Rhodospirillaceae bacterium]|nr:MAG: hypothetical protein A2018_06765 [Alphaproteobacteria bacterium GWF2_58_20]HAU29884.1 hypothetical protein [Rhodospirillaceae bacterium]
MSGVSDPPKALDNVCPIHDPRAIAPAPSKPIISGLASAAAAGAANATCIPPLSSGKFGAGFSRGKSRSVQPSGLADAPNRLPAKGFPPVWKPFPCREVVSVATLAFCKNGVRCGAERPCLRTCSRAAA